MRWISVALVALLALPTGAAVVGQEGTQPAEATRCSPPCGEINPRLLFTFSDLSDDPVTLAPGESVTFEGTVTYWMDVDDEGYAPRDPQQPILIRFSFPRLPDWAQMSVEPTEIEVPVNTCATCFEPSADSPTQPATHWAYDNEVQLTVEAADTPKATSGYDYGKLQLFAKSSESGIYNPGYGIREVRVAPGGGDELASNSADESGTPGAGAIGALAALAAVAVAARARRS